VIENSESETLTSPMVFEQFDRLLHDLLRLDVRDAPSKGKLGSLVLSRSEQDLEALLDLVHLREASDNSLVGSLLKQHCEAGQ
jgi:hypothetical protein